MSISLYTGSTFGAHLRIGNSGIEKIKKILDRLGMVGYSFIFQGIFTMLKLIIEKELLTRFYDATFVIACILSAMLIFLSFYLSVCNYGELVNDYNGIQTLNKNLLQAQERYLDIDAKGIGISKPPEVLAIFNVGIANYIGRNLNINSYGTPQLHGSKVEGNPIFAIFGDLDLTFIVKYIFSLLAIVFSYNMLSGEKEAGTLRLVASFPLPRDALILGKLIGGLLCLLIPLFIPTLLGLAVFLLLPNIQFASDDWLRLIFILGVFLLYLTVFFLIGAFVSARTKSSSVSFLIALFIWILVVLVIPKSSIIIAAQFIHAPSSHQHRIEKAQVRQDIFNKYNQIDEKLWRDWMVLSQKKMAAVGETRREYEKQLNEYEKQLNEYEKQLNEKIKENEKQQDAELNKAYARIDREYQQRQQNLANLAIALSRTSPAATMTHATILFADTGMISFDHFIRSARAYRERYIAFIIPKTKSERRILGERMVVTDEDGNLIEDSIKSTPKPNLNEIPVFTYQKMSLASVLQATLIDILLLVLLCLLLFIFTYVSFLKYDVR